MHIYIEISNTFKSAGNIVNYTFDLFSEYMHYNDSNKNLFSLSYYISYYSITCVVIFIVRLILT